MHKLDFGYCDDINLYGKILMCFDKGNMLDQQGQGRDCHTWSQSIAGK